MANIKIKKSSFSKFSPKRKMIVIFFLILFIASIIFIVIPMVGGIEGFGNIGVWFPTAYFFALFAVTYNLENLRKLLRKAYRPLIFIFYSGMILFVIVFMIFCVLIMGYTLETIPDNPDLIIVLGCQVRGHEPGNLLRYRLNTALETLNKYPETICVVSGGQGPDEIVQEAKVMKQYLADRGIAEDRIYEEGESSSSFQNLSFSKKVIEENNLKHENIIIITSQYHVPRTIMIANRIYSDTNFYAVKSSTPFALFSAGIVREFFAFVKSFIFDKV